MFFRIIFLYLFTLLLHSCDNKKTVLIDEKIKAVGNIINDSVYNGVIKYYDIKTGKLIKEYTYKNGLREGQAKEYYPNGILAADIFFKNDHRDGYSFYYNEKGKIIQKDFFYYDLLVGSTFNYDSSIYKFSSLDGRELLVLSYANLKSVKSITNLIKEYFFFYPNKYYIANNNKIGIAYEYFLYTPAPPDFHFAYSLVEVDREYKVLNTIINFNDTLPWVKFTLPAPPSNGNKFAIRLRLKDINGQYLNLIKAIEPLQ